MEGPGGRHTHPDTRTHAHTDTLTARVHHRNSTEALFYFFLLSFNKTGAETVGGQTSKLSPAMSRQNCLHLIATFDRLAVCPCFSFFLYFCLMSMLLIRKLENGYIKMNY